MKVRNARKTIRVISQGSGEVHQVGAIPTHLLHRVKTLGVSLKKADILGTFKHADPSPLLEFDDHIRRCLSARVQPAKHDIGALARERQLILDKRLHVAKTCLQEIGGQDLQTPLPGPNLRRRS